MAYFGNFPLIDYKFSLTDKQGKLCTNLMASSRILDIIPERSNKLYIDYIIKDGEKPEHIAHRVYGQSDLHWLVLLSNGVMSPYFSWPFSQSELEDQITETYPGAAIFFNCVPGTFKFDITDSTSQLSLIESQFIVGNTITQGDRTATVIDWDPTLRRLIVDDADPDLNFDTESAIISESQNGTEFEVIPKKVVLEHADSLHHFEDDFHNFLDPYGKIDLTQYNDNKIYSRQNIFYSNTDGIQTFNDSNDFALRRYINGEFEDHAITNRNYEININDRKRNIKLLKIEYANKIISELQSIFT